MNTTTRLVERSATRKVVGSLAILGTAAAVAGLGTYGNFTDSTTPMNTTVDTGTLSINLAQPGGAVAIPVTTSGFVPGDSISRAVNLINDGNSALGSVNVASALTSPADQPHHGHRQRPPAVRQGLLRGLDPGRHPHGADLHLRRHRAHDPLRPGRHQRGPGQPGQPRGRRRRQPRVHDLAARHRGQHVPGQERLAEPDLHRRPAHRHRPLIAG